MKLMTSSCGTRCGGGGSGVTARVSRAAAAARFSAEPPTSVLRCGGVAIGVPRCGRVLLRVCVCACVCVGVGVSVSVWSACAPRSTRARACAPSHLCGPTPPPLLPAPPGRRAPPRVRARWASPERRKPRSPSLLESVADCVNPYVSSHRAAGALCRCSRSRPMSDMADRRSTCVHTRARTCTHGRSRARARARAPAEPARVPPPARRPRRFRRGGEPRARVLRPVPRPAVELRFAL